MRARFVAVRLAVAALAIATLGCGLVPGMGDSGGLEPVDVPIAFAAPEMVTIRPGDTLAKLAKRHGVDVAELRAWNGLEGDTIEVDQVLLLWKAPPPAKPPTRVAAAPVGSDITVSGGLAEVIPPAQALPPGAGSTAAPEAGAPQAAGAPIAGTPDAAQVPRERVAIERPMLAGLFGMQVGSDVDLAEAARGMERLEGSAGGTTDLGGRSLGAGTDAEALQVAERQLTRVGPAIPDVPVVAPRLSKPAPKACLRGPAATVSESGKVTSGGLSVADINAGMGRISRYTVRCFPAGTQGSYQVIFEVTVGCNGTVSNVFLVNGGVVPPRVTTCIEQTLRYAGFAAHAQPDGSSFQYPMKFTF